MEYREIVAVTGLGGLFQLLATKSDGAIVRNLSDKSTKFISARLHNVTPLESIEVYTTGDNVRLHEVFKKMQDNEGSIAIVDGKTADNAAIKNYFKSIFPDFDEERVYVSDMKKMLKWYDLLKGNDLLKFEEVAEEALVEEAIEAPAKASKAKATAAAEATAEEGPAEKPAKKARAKKAAEPAEAGEEKPAKKTARKKKTEE
ncbi:DUF5606 domain-containing protein [Polluticoccus soli]|uniref:DUF5606 family protein n=1 Tax=Polluticoccus soli TaxID=3034150 RepID=UPI0023E313C3|nr:DUF5606 domain-containing protein [Flavipsychrobacter sp. JY13-12]